MASRPLSRLHPASVIATWCGCGRLPVAPGSWASLAAVLVAWPIRAGSGSLGLTVAAVLVFFAGWWAAARFVRHSDEKDPGAVVVDEVAAQWLVLAVLPHSLPGYVLGFALFRLADIAKPWPASWADKNVGGGLGIMLDDLFAALYAGIAGFILFQWVF